MEKYYLYLIVLTLFCLVEEIKAGISCRDASSPFIVHIICIPGDTKEHNITMKEIEVALPKFRKKKDVEFL